MPTTATTDRRGYLLIDVDGVLNPHPKRPKRPPGYETERVSLPGGRGYRRLTCWYKPDHGRQLLELAEQADLQLAWCSQGWNPGHANSHYGTWLNLPPLPGVWFPEATFEFTRWKFDKVREFVGDTPFAWLDDDFGAVRDRQVRTAFEKAYGERGLLVEVDGYHGLRDEHLEKVSSWAATVAVTQ